MSPKNKKISNLKIRKKKKKKEVKTCFYICLEEKKNETVCHFPTFLGQGITLDA